MVVCRANVICPRQLIMVTYVYHPQNVCLLGLKKYPMFLLVMMLFHWRWPYPQSGLTDERRIFNYRLSTARRIFENLFGIIANRWRVFRSVILLSPKSIEVMLMATLTIHNFLRKSPSRNIYCPAGLTDSENSSGDFNPGFWRKDPPRNFVLRLQIPQSGHNASKDAKQVREIFKDYFFNEGAVEWQWDKC